MVAGDGVCDAVAAITESKRTLEDSTASAAECCKAIDCLVALQSISVDVMRETQIGKIVNMLSKKSADADIRAKCGKLVQAWKQQVRQATTAVESPGAKRKLEGESAKVSDTSYIKRILAAPRQPSSEPPDIQSHFAAASSSHIPPMHDDRRRALQEGGERALVKEVAHYLRENGREASFDALNVHIQRIWTGAARVVVDRFAPRGPGGAPVVGRKLVKRHADQFELKKIFKSTPGSRKGKLKGYVVGVHVRLLG